jgi:hypothetical protein
VLVRAEDQRDVGEIRRGGGRRLLPDAILNPAWPYQVSEADRMTRSASRSFIFSV